ncbi:hypothetical protein SDC9_112727 [bioreactor metagenome]|uniref:Uncharacterized protein n=1 Tax=bioreactor metagenome TaxID=1076179 RepID=A0A645BRH0_9ZZZZ
MSANGGDCRARHAKLRKAEQTEDQDRVEDDVEHRADDLHQHRLEVHALRLQDTFAIDLHEQADRKNHDNGKIGNAVLRRFGIARIGFDERARAKDAEENEDHGGEQHDEEAVARRFLRVRMLLCAEFAGDQRVDANAGADGDGDHEHKNRIGEGDCGQRVFPEIGDKNTVYNVV